MNKEIRFLKYLENKINVSKEWAINSLILFLPTFVVCCMNFSKMLNFKSISKMVGIGLGVIAWIGIVCIIKHVKTKKCKKIVEEILKFYPVGKIIDKKLDGNLKDEFLHKIAETFSKNGISQISVEQTEGWRSPWTILLVFHKDGDEKFRSGFSCEELSQIKRLRDFLLN